MTDNALVYTRSALFQQLLRGIGVRHITIPAYTPRGNGKAERVIRTLQDEWAYGTAGTPPSSAHGALRSILRYDDRRRPHSRLNDRPPISRVHNLCGHDT